MTFDFSELLAALPDADESVMAQDTQEADDIKAPPPDPMPAWFNAHELMADLFEIKQQVYRQLQRPKGKKAVKSKGYFDEIAAADRPWKDKRNKASPGRPKKGSRK
jgi:hypothetical protein